MNNINDNLLHAVACKKEAQFLQFFLGKSLGHLH